MVLSHTLYNRSLAAVDADVHSATHDKVGVDGQPKLDLRTLSSIGLYLVSRVQHQCFFMLFYILANQKIDRTSPIAVPIETNNNIVNAAAFIDSCNC
jgi:hypothetical protein